MICSKFKQLYGRVLITTLTLLVLSRIACLIALRFADFSYLFLVFNASLSWRLPIFHCSKDVRWTKNWNPKCNWNCKVVAD